MAPLLLLASAASAQPVWNIAEHGARPDRDVATVINEGLRTQPEHGLPVFIPSGRWGIGSTIELPKRDGGVLLGAAAAGGNANDSLRGLDSVLEWYGDPAEPMLRMTGSRWRVENLSLRGRPFLSDREKAAIGLLVTKSGKGLGSGKHEFRNLFVADCKVGVQCGLTPEEHNNDLLGFQRLVFNNCAVGYRSTNAQAMAHWIERLEARDTPLVFDFLGGGMLHARNIMLFDAKLLRIRQNDPKRYSPGANNNLFRFENLKVDAQHAGQFVLVETHNRSSANIVLTGAMISGPHPFTLAKIGGKTRLVLRDVFSPTSDAMIDKQPGAEVILDNVPIKGIEQ